MASGLRRATLLPDAPNALSGVYGIVDCAGRWYIGSTKNFKRRKTDHFRDLRSGKHHSKRLQQAYWALGESNFSFHVLEPVLLESDFLKREQKWMKKKGAELNGSPVAGRAMRRQGGDSESRLSPEIRRRLDAQKKPKRKRPPDAETFLRLKTFEQNFREYACREIEPGYVVDVVAITLWETLRVIQQDQEYVPGMIDQIFQQVGARFIESWYDRRVPAGSATISPALVNDAENTGKT